MGDYGQVTRDFAVLDIHVEDCFQRTVDQCQRRAHFMGYLRKEFYLSLIEFLFFFYLEEFLFLFHLPFLTAFVPAEPAVYQAEYKDRINGISPGG